MTYQKIKLSSGEMVHTVTIDTGKILEKLGLKYLERGKMGLNRQLAEDAISFTFEEVMNVIRQKEARSFKRKKRP